MAGVHSRHAACHVRDGNDTCISLWAVATVSQQASLERAGVRVVFREGRATFGRDAPVLLMGHHDADGLGALALRTRGFRSAWREVLTRIVGRGENPDFLAHHAPPRADEHYGSGHQRAAGGALRIPDWNAFAAGLGLGPQAQVSS